MTEKKSASSPMEELAEIKAEIDKLWKMWGALIKVLEPAQVKRAGRDTSWCVNFITTRYTAWDESQANELGTFDTYEEAVQALLDYAKTLEVKNETD